MAWGSELEEMIKAVRETPPEEITDCPNDGWNLHKVNGVLHCPFCGWTPEIDNTNR